MLGRPGRRCAHRDAGAGQRGDAQGHDAVDPAALAAQIHRYRSAVLLGASQTAARSGKLMKKHHALARRLLDRQDDYLRFTATGGSRRTTTAPSATSAWPN